MLDRSTATPLTILTGFLGAGKTTLLNRVLNGEHGLRVAVLVNDFGAINIDAELVVGVEGGTVSLSNGCVCCQIQDDLLDALWQMLARPDPIDYILLEASGVADPAGILVTFNDAALRDRIRLDSITCIVDADQVFVHADRPEFVRLKMMQIACADLTVLNKVDLAGEEQVAKVRAWLDDNFMRLRVVETSHADVPLEVLLSVGRFDPAATIAAPAGHECGGPTCGDGSRVHRHRHDADHGAMFSTWSFESERPVCLATLREIARRELPASIYRCKGIVFSAEDPDRSAILQVVGRRSDVSVGAAWGDRVPRTRIVAIGAAGALETDRLRALFERCLLAPDVATVRSH